MKKYLLAISIVIYALISFSQGVSINADGSMPAAGAMLDVSSTTGGLLIPRMTEAQRDAISPDTQSMLIYQIDNDSGFYFYDGVNWTPFLIGGAAANSGWSTTGNAGTTVGTNFLGTTDTEDFAIYTNNSERLRVDQSGNVGIGTTSPGTLLEVQSATSQGNIRISGLSDGGATYSALYFDDENISDLKNYWVLGYTKAVGSGGLENGFSLSRISKTGTLVRPFLVDTMGNIGIGATNPASILDIEHASAAFISLRDGNATLNSPNQSTGILTYDQSGNFTSHIGFTGTADETFHIANYNDGGNISFNTGGNINRVLIDSSGNVGIGTTSPSQRLDIKDVGLPTNSTSRLANIESYNTGDALLWGHTNTLASASLGAKSGNGAAYLQFFAYHSNNANSSRYTGNPYGGGDIAYPGRILSDDGTENNVFAFESGDSPGQDSEITWTKRMVINEGGNVGIGTTLPFSKLHVDNTGTSTRFDVMSRNPTPTDIQDFYVTTDYTKNYVHIDIGGNNHSSDRFHFGDLTTSVNTITTLGNVGIGTTSPSAKLEVCGNTRIVGQIAANSSNLSAGLTCSSDKRLKKHINSITDPLSIIQKIDGKTYYWRSDKYKNRGYDSKKQFGFIAQQIEEVLPELVVTQDDGFKSVDYIKVIPILTEAIKEQQQLIESLTTNNQSLQTEVSQLKAAIKNVAQQDELNAVKAELRQMQELLNQTGYTK